MQLILSLRYFENEAIMCQLTIINWNWHQKHTNEFYLRIVPKWKETAVEKRSIMMLFSNIIILHYYYGFSSNMQKENNIVDSRLERYESNWNDFIQKSGDVRRSKKYPTTYHLY
jgi:hypothetical protein